MAIREGRCQNCGSIIKVDEAKDDAVCLFCLAHTAPSTAIAIAQNPEAHEFPNEPQEATEEDRALAMQGAGLQVHGTAKVSKPAPKKTKKAGLSPAEKVAQSKKELVVPSVARRDLVKVIGASVLLIAVVVGVFLPVTLNRNQKRAELQAQWSELKEGHFQFEGNGNHRLILVKTEKVDEEGAKMLLSAYKEVRAKVYGLSSEAQEEVSLKLYTPDGIMLVKGEAVERQAP